MNKNVLLLAGLLAFGPAAQAQWATVPVGFPSPATPFFIKAVDANTVWTIGYDLLGSNTNQYARSSDGGRTWTAGVIAGVGGDEQVTSLTALSAQTAWVTVAGNRHDSRILKTADGGTSWVRQTMAAQFGSVNGYPDVVHFFNALEGVSVGDPAEDSGPFEIYTTANGGTTWTVAANPPVSLTREDAADNVYAVSGNAIWCGTLAGRIMRSLDKGATWTVVETTLAGGIQGLAFRDAQNGLACFTDSDTGVRQLVRTTDGGASWASVAFTGVFPGFGLDNVPGTNEYLSTGLDIGDGVKGSAYSRDNGQTWITLENTLDNLYVDAISPTAAWTGAVDINTAQGLGMRRLNSTVLPTRAAADPSGAGLSASPNPSPDGRFLLSSTAALPAGAEVSVTDALGREIMRKPWKGQLATPFSLDLSQYHAGVYTLQLRTPAGISRQKLVVE